MHELKTWAIFKFQMNKYMGVTTFGYTIRIETILGNRWRHLENKVLLNTSTKVGKEASTVTSNCYLKFPGQMVQLRLHIPSDIIVISPTVDHSSTINVKGNGRVVLLP